MTTHEYSLKESFQQAWKVAVDSGTRAPPWQEYVAYALSEELLIDLLEFDIVQRVDSGLPGIISQRYWEHASVLGRLSDGQKIGLVRCELIRKWNSGELELPTSDREGASIVVASRDAKERSLKAIISQYVAAFPELSNTPLWKNFPWEEVDAEITDELSETIDPKSEDSIELDDVTLDPTPESPSPIRKTFGRYRVLSLLGKGGFGRVYRAVDDQLRRDVAIKVTLGSALGSGWQESFLKEAQIVASLDHPNIVPLHDVGQTERGDFYVVSKLIDGSDLANRMKQGRLDRIHSLRIVEQIADALNYAHSRGLVHRDVKPSNILVDHTDRPYLADFGIAIRESEQRKPGEIAGTPAYMSPEQARGLGHVIDNRSDIYSLGVVLYELLAGRRPFRPADSKDLLKLIATEDVRTPRLYDDTIPVELERICLKALSRRVNDRYTVARDFGEEIRIFLANYPSSQGPRLSSVELGSTPPPSSQPTPHSISGGSSITDSERTGPTRVVPKGLRSFNSDDSSFFLELLPGPLDRDGLPESIRFWKTRIERTDSDRTFRLGLIYGPSGCGKSSLVKAGLLPRLSPKIQTVYIESTPDDTETRLLRGIRKLIPEATGTSLKEVLSCVRRRKLVPSGGKLLLVLDQFEQWLFGEQDYAKASLTDALMQCDGSAIQAIVMVREDFWISVSRFFKEMEIRIVEGENSGMVDLFGLDHASKVLGLFGKAYGILPESSKDWTPEQHAFIRESVQSLSREGKVISVQLAILADMMKQKPWTPGVLRDLGGIEGVGVTFLEEMFGSRHAPLQHRQHQLGVRGLLSSLLPSIGTDIKGTRQSMLQLQSAAGYADQPLAFQELIEILDKNLHLITPVDDADAVEGGKTQSYQLAHDYLVPSLREWLTRKQRETKRGRAELKLAERASVWGSKPEDKQLPTLLEWFQIRRWTDRKRWTHPEELLMRRANWVHLRNWGSSCLALLLLGSLAGYLYRQEYIRGQGAKIVVVLDSLERNSGPTVPLNIEKLEEMRQGGLIRRALADRFAKSQREQGKLSLAFAMSSFGMVDPEYMISRLDFIEDGDLGNLIDALGNDRQRSLATLSQEGARCLTPDTHRRKARLALAALALGDTALPTDVCEYEGRPDPGVRTQFIDEFRRWKLDLGEVIDTVKDTEHSGLRSGICLAIGRLAVDEVPPETKNRIAEVVSKWFSLPDSSTHSASAWLMRQWQLPEPKIADATQIVPGRNWFVNSQGTTFIKITPPTPTYKPLADPVENARSLIAPISELANPGQYLFRGRRFYEVGKYQDALADFDTYLTLPDNPLDKQPERTRNEAIYWRLITLARLRRSQETADALTEWLKTNPDEDWKKRVACVLPLWLGHKEEATQAIGELIASTPSEKRFVLGEILAIFASDESATPEEKKKWIELSLSFLESQKYDEPTRRGRRQNVNFKVLIDEPRFLKLFGVLSGPERVYWLADKEVSRGEFKEFIMDEDYPVWKKPKEWEKSNSRNWCEQPDGPIETATWFDAVMYCNWLSAKEGLKPAYLGRAKWEKIMDGEGRWVEAPVWIIDESADGYRLPTDLEWEFACRAGSTTRWSFGDESSFLNDYIERSWQSLSYCRKKMPNAWGFFDMHGNVWEWCSDLAQNTNRVMRRDSSDPRWASALYFGVGFRLTRSSIAEPLP